MVTYKRAESDVKTVTVAEEGVVPTPPPEMAGLGLALAIGIGLYALSKREKRER